jgi:hypothetical protein
MKNSIFTINRLYAFILILLGTAVISCDEDEPAKEDTPELITKVTLTFTPVTGAAIEVTAEDPDNIGLQDIVTEPIALKRNTTYTLRISLINGLADPGDDAYDIGKEVEEEAEEHMFFFSWTGGFTSPTGNGNIDKREDVVGYADEDANGLPLGLLTTWTTTSEVAVEKTLRIVLKHQPGLKSTSSTAQDGETDIDLEFDLSIVN